MCLVLALTVSIVAASTAICFFYLDSSSQVSLPPATCHMP